MTTATPDVTVVLAAYNHERFVRAAIDSVLAQEGVTLELLVGDDASSDGTIAAIRAVQDPRLQLFPSATNRGQAATTNDLLRRARGEFIAVINSDDVWVGRDKLARQAALLRSRPEVAATFGLAGFIGPDGQVLAKDSPAALAAGSRLFEQVNRDRAQWLRQFLLGGNCLCHTSVLLRRTCHETLGLYDTRLRQIMDLDLWIRIARRHELHVDDRELVQFRVLEGANASAITPANMARLRNEESLVFQSFFDGVDGATLRAGFGDRMVNPSAATPEELAVEQALLYFQCNGDAQAVCWTLGLERIFDLLGDARHRPALQAYGIDEPWLHERMAVFSPFLPDGPQPAPPAAEAPEAPGLLRRWLGRKR